MKHVHLLLVALMVCPLARAADIEQLTRESRAATMTLGSKLKATLRAKLGSAHPTDAIKDCKIEVPWLTEKISLEQDMQIERTSLKPRNPANAPDAWERAVLEEFEQRKAAGEALSDLEYSEITVQDGTRVFRYMKAIPTDDICLLCHGEEVSPDLAAELERLYPNGSGSGFRKGDIRGAFAVTRDID